MGVPEVKITLAMAQSAAQELGVSLEAGAIVASLNAQYSTLADRLANLEAAIVRGQTPLYNKGASKNAPLTVALNLREVGAVTVEVFVKSSVPATYHIEGSVDGVNWRDMDSLVLDAPGQRHSGFMNAYPVVRVRTEEIGNHEIEIVAAR